MTDFTIVDFFVALTLMGVAIAGVIHSRIQMRRKQF